MQLRKRVIIYDPTESEEKKFKICDDSGTYEDEEESQADGDESENNEDDETAPKKEMKFDSELSQHFWDIIHDPDLNNLLIDHKNSGPSLDISRIHYALTEWNGRLEEGDMPNNKLL